MCLPLRRVQVDLRAAAQTHAIRRGHDRPRAEFYGSGHRLEAANFQINVVPFLFLHRQQQLHNVRAHGKVRRVAADDERLKTGHRIALCP